MSVCVTNVYFDKRRKFDPHCFNTNNSGFVKVHGYESPEEATKARFKLLARPGFESLKMERV